MYRKPKLDVRHTVDIALSHYTAHIYKDARSTLRMDILGTHMPDRPDIWEEKLYRGGGFSAVPKNIDEIRRILGIEDNHRVIVAPVYSGEWSLIHKDAIGVDFAVRALWRHPNKNRVLADFRNLPLPNEYADHIVSYEPTPMHSRTATPADVLKTLREFVRVADKIHIIQRALGRTPMWSSPFLTKYLSAMGIPYQIKDITEHVQLRADKKYNVVVLSIDGRSAREKMKEMEKDVLAMELLVGDLNNGAQIHHALRRSLRYASPALKAALLERYFGWILKHKTTPLHRGQQST